MRQVRAFPGMYISFLVTQRQTKLTYSANSRPQGSFLPVESKARSASGTAWTCILASVCCIAQGCVVQVNVYDDGSLGQKPLVAAGKSDKPLRCATGSQQTFPPFTHIAYANRNSAAWLRPRIQMDPDLYLTPVKIRGKKRKHPLIPIAATVDSSEHSVPTTESSSPAKYHRAKKIRKLRKRIVAAMPTLIGLPVELLEIIFLHSMNIALPRASPLLGRKLSSQAITLEFTMRRFFHTVDHKTNYRDRLKTSDPVIQSEVLACHFFTWDFFIKYVDRAHDAMIALRGKAWEKTGIEVPGVRLFDGLWPFRFTTIPYLAFAEGFHVPEKLLHGPWDDDKVNLLYVLVSLNGEIDWKGSMAGETAKQGIRRRWRRATRGL